MASWVSESFREVMKIKMKDRHDDLADQFTRIFIVKVLVLSSLITGLGKVFLTVFSKLSITILFPALILM